jgi:hypothetical protein
MNTTLEPEITAAPKPQTKAEKITAFLAGRRAELHNRLAGLDALEKVMLLVPDALLPKCSEQAYGLDLDHLTRDEVVLAMREMGGGKWEKKQNGCNPLALDYETRIYGVRVRMWAASPPGTCRIIEETVEIPASKQTVRRLICA